MYYLSVFLSRAGVCARRKAVLLIKNGHVFVNGQKIIDPTTKVSHSDEIIVEGKKIEIKEFVYIIFNKPRGCLTAVSDERGRKTVMDYIDLDIPLFHIGRLDKETTGILLLTNDGQLAQQLMHPSYGIEKEYHATLDKPLEKKDLEKIKQGLNLDDGVIKVDAISYLNKKNQKEIDIILHSGKKRIIRRIFSFCGYKVMNLDRVRYAHLTKKNIPVGSYRELAQNEIEELFKSVKK